MDDTLEAKLIAIAILGYCSTICGVIPMTALALLRRRGGHKATLGITADSVFFSLCLCFGAGVLLSTLLCHMIPESLEAWADIQKSGAVAENDVPVPSILIGVGFFLVYLVEEIAHKLMHGAQRRAGRRVDIELAACPSDGASVTDVRGSPGPEATHGHNGRADDTSGHVHMPEAHSHGAAIANTQGGVFVTVLLLIALSFHAILEGIAVGAEKTKQDVYIMLGAVCGHKFILVFILGLEMLNTSIPPHTQFGCVCIFTWATLVGIGIGIAASEAKGLAHDVVLMVMQTLASGTLMYVCFMEVLTRERSRKGHALARFACTLFGFVLLAILVSVLTEPEEADDDGQVKHVRIW